VLPRTIAHYELLEQLGAGGMGVVYKARDTHLGRITAIKVLPPDKVADRERHRRFVREARAASTLNHPNIVTIFDIADENGVDFIAMEYVPGRNLAEIAAARALPLDQALDCAAQIADALAAAHESGIVHRDLKPGNVMVTEGGRVKLLDFGLAKLVEAGVGEDSDTRTIETCAGAVLGTPAYMSPEQVNGKTADARSDIFSFGALLYELLAGRRAFERPSVVSTLHAVACEEPPPFPPSVPVGIRDVVFRCLRKNPGERFQTAAALKSALESARRCGSGPSAATAPSIAVLPFANLSAEKDNEYFSDGLAEEIINALTQLPGLRVTARTSAFAFRGKDMDVREIGAKLGVEHILEGSVRKAGDRIRVTAQLVKASDGYHLWSRRFDRAMTDVFAIQDEISEAIVDGLRVRLVGPEVAAKRRTANIEAYNLLLKGRYLLNRPTLESLEKSRACFEQAVALDPDYALAWCGLAEYSFNSAYYGLMPAVDRMPRGRTAALRAIELDPTLAEGHAMLAIYYALFEYDWPAAEREFRAALELSGESVTVQALYAYFYLRPMGRLDEAVIRLERALEQDPLSPLLYTRLGYALHVRRSLEKAIDVLRKAIELNPDAHMPHVVLAVALGNGPGGFAQAVAEAEKAVQLSGRNSFTLGVLGICYCLSGERHEELERLREEMFDRARGGYVSPLHIAWLHLCPPNADLYFEWAGKAIDAHDPFLPGHLNLEPTLDWLRPDPRLRALCARMNLGY
jgi:serine/threonine-protein kinase